MALLPVIQLPDVRLRQRSSPVDVFDPSVGALVDDLFATLAHYGGIGLCAPQTGCLQRVLVVHVPDDSYGPRTYINPEILFAGTPGFVEESCLSVPGVVGNVIRRTRLRVRAQDRFGAVFETDIDGMHAVCLQHEIDHLDGRLFIDRLSWFKKLRMRLSGAGAVLDRASAA